MNKKEENAKLSVDPSWAVPTGTSTTMIDQSTNPKRVYGLDGDDVKEKPNVVGEELKDKGQTWTFTQVETKDAANTFYTFSIENYFLTAGNEKLLTVQGT